MNLPNEIWLTISDILGSSGEIRSMINLHKVLRWKGIGEKYIVIALYKSRHNIFEKYDDKMIQLWKKTGIDDGVPYDYIFNHQEYFKQNRLYRTVWALEFIEKGNISKMYFDYNQNEFIKYTDRIFLDRRSIDIQDNGIYYNQHRHDKKSYESLLKSIKCRKYIRYKLTQNDIEIYDI